MKSTDVLKLYQAITGWLDGTDTLLAIQALLGDTAGQLSVMLLQNGLMSNGFKPNPDYSHAYIQDCIFLYLAMRHAR